MDDRNSYFKVGPHKIIGDLVLAPMDGYTSWPFRSICRELGSAISYTEFVKAEDVLQRPHYIEKKVQFTESERPIFFQIYGNDPDIILNAALNLQDNEPDGIDINMGCPNRSIASRGAGAGLMRTPLKAARIIKKLNSDLDVPVTAKIRTGWKDCRNGDLLARIIEEFGGKLVAVHARAKEMGHEGAPDLPALRNIANKLSIPVLGNGGVKTVSDIQAMKKIGDCEGVMIGRAALENPWIFSRRDRSEISTNEVQELLLKHLERSLSFFGKTDGLVLFRKHTANYLNPYHLDPEIRRSLLTETDPEQFIRLIHQVFDHLNN